jgi:predicted aminopeptidase
VQVLQRARPVDDWLADPATPPALRERLALATTLRAFSVRELELPDNPSYRRFAELGRRRRGLERRGHPRALARAQDAGATR